MAHNKICQAKRCPEETVGRVRDKRTDRRKDLCNRHLKLVLLNMLANEVELVEVWGTLEPLDEQERDGVREEQASEATP